MGAHLHRVAGLVTQGITPMIHGPARSSEETLGRGLATLVVLLIGLGLCITHFLRSRGK